MTTCTPAAWTPQVSVRPADSCYPGVMRQCCVMSQTAWMFSRAGLGEIGPHHTHQDSLHRCSPISELHCWMSWRLSCQRERRSTLTLCREELKPVWMMKQPEPCVITGCLLLSESSRRGSELANVSVTLLSHQVTMMKTGRVSRRFSQQAEDVIIYLLMVKSFKVKLIKRHFMLCLCCFVVIVQFLNSQK